MRDDLVASERLTRRRLLRLAAAAVSAAAVLAAALAAQGGTGLPDTAVRRREAIGRLSDPTVAGRPRSPTTDADNDAAIQALEKRLRCGCGCTLDVYTCRTTDFTCTYSPELHREVVALWNDGRSADEILDAFVAKYGEEALMAPEPEGFNLAGYLVPGVVVTGLGATLLWVLLRRARIARTAEAGTVSAASAVSATSAAPAAPAPTPAELAALERALAEDELR